MTTVNKSNHLKNEASPYLQQHAHNPVDWYPWNQEALDKARRENKPILLSIGYAACHWCHVMAHESFEDDETAEIMNKYFVNIKVDREERPDLDKVYQTAHYLLTQRNGGWPLTVFLTPEDLTPFFSGNYFPLEPHYQLPPFKEVLNEIAKLYAQRKSDIQKQNADLSAVLHQPRATISDLRLNDQPIQHALQSLSRHFDEKNGGFGGAPKFPQPIRLDFLLQHNSPSALYTLEQMARGGIYDQLSGGFYRYTVDANWRIPHFEKMLYDNAQLIYLYSIASKKFSNPFFAEIARETANWVISNMQAANGGYYSSYDADSEGEEGKFYVWDKKEISKILTQEEYALIESYFGLDQEPNFENHWHFYQAKNIEDLAENVNIKNSKEILVSAKEKLLHARSKRIPPHRDEKILTSWNALMIKAMLTAGTIMHESKYIDSALRAFNYLFKNHWKNGRLLAVSKDDKAHLSAYLDDYAFLLHACIILLEANWDSKIFNFALNLANTMIDQFADMENGGFFFTANDHEKLLYRPKTMMDEASPSGNGVAAFCLLILGNLLAEKKYLNAAEKTLHAAWPMLTAYPAEHCSLLIALQEFLKPSDIVIIRGKEKDLPQWKDSSKTLSNFVFAIKDDETNLPEALAVKTSEDSTCAYICKGTQCSAKIEDISELKHHLKLSG